ncbi:MAG: hypothetical protein ACOCP4_03330 [Candidatus Woesearchaeota archaeon]
MNNKIMSDTIFILKKSFKQFYNNFLYLFMINLILVVLNFLVITFGIFSFYNGNYLNVFLLYFVFMFLFIIGEFIIGQYVNFRYVRLKKVFNFLNNNFKKLLVFFTLLFLSYSLFIVDIFYFINQAVGSNNLVLRYLFFLLVFISIYVLIILTIINFYIWGLLIHKKDIGILDIFKQAMILTFNNMGFSLLIIFTISILIFTSVFTGFGLIILIPTLLYIIIFNSMDMVLGDYDSAN